MALALPGRRGRPRQRRPHGLAGFLFVAPFMIVFVAMFVAPLGYAGYLSLFRTQIVGGTVFTGLDNYVDAFHDPQLRAGLARIVKFFFVQVPLSMVLATVFALLIDSGRVWAPKVFRLAFFVPYAVPAVVASLLWGYMYGRKFGAFTQLAEHMGLANPDFLSAGHLLPSIANVVTWEFTGYNMIILYAALQAIPGELYEAAALDGAGPIRTALYVKLPLLRPALGVILLFSIIGAFQLFNEPQVLIPSAGAAITPDWTPNLYVYNLAFTDQQTNYAAAVSFALGLVILVATYVVFGLGKLRRPR
ncbi:carbohydrate ABC transporter permease [Streptomyces sp. NPDC090088]|uniref:carbohydrate ABC transporter permease n=1 Tax=Streptomyces sp. NPDC090088 TaxID=3365944 RepID=UPI0037FE4E0A